MILTFGTVKQNCGDESEFFFGKLVPLCQTILYNEPEGNKNRHPSKSQLLYTELD